MTPFDIRWNFIDLPGPEAGLSAESVARIKRLYFLDAGNRWRYVLRGWPLDAGKQPLRLPGGQVFSYLEIGVRFGTFCSGDASAVARVPASSIERLASAPHFPYRAEIHVDLADLQRLLAHRALFFDTIVHEIGHVLGLGTSWEGQIGPVLTRHLPGQVLYTGTAGCREFARAQGLPFGTPIEIPLVKECQGTTAAYHWDEQALQFDIMSTELDQPVAGGSGAAAGNVISSVSVAALKDLGYLVEFRAAQPMPGR